MYVHVSMNTERTVFVYFIQVGIYDPGTVPESQAPESRQEEGQNRRIFGRVHRMKPFLAADKLIECPGDVTRS